MNGIPISIEYLKIRINIIFSLSNRFLKDRVHIYVRNFQAK